MLFCGTGLCAIATRGKDGEKMMKWPFRNVIKEKNLSGESIDQKGRAHHVTLKDKLKQSTGHGLEQYSSFAYSIPDTLGFKYKFLCHELKKGL